MRQAIATIGFLLISVFSYAQQTQVVSGYVFDEASHAPLIGAVIILQSNSSLGTTTDENGNFRLANVPIGRQSFKISYSGYEERLIADIIVTAGKEVNLNINMQEAVKKLNDVTIKYNKAKDRTRTNNEMAMVSARSFNVDDTKKYAGSLGDPSRMAANFAGVVSGNDSRNDIVVRGNSPTGMLWRMDDLNIPNPNHYGAIYSSGGPVSILNNNNLDKSDFLTSAYPAQYGNALAGVFDLRMRSGNKEKAEFVGQIGFNGFEAGAEGPISKKSQSSYVINYRYSTLGVFKALGINFGTGQAVPVYQDVNYKFVTNVGKHGKMSLFGFAGNSKIDILGNDVDTSETNLYGNAYNNAYARFATTVTGASYEHQFSEKTSSKLTLGYSTTYQNYTEDSISYKDRSIVMPSGAAKLTTNNLSAVWGLLHKFNSKNSLQAGIIYDHSIFDIMNKKTYPVNIDVVYVNMKDNYGLGQAYLQWKHRFSNSLSLVTGVHGQYLTLNNTMAIEPRANLRYAINSKHTLGLGYGLNHQTQGIYTYYVQTVTPAGISYTNKNLGFTRSNQFVLSYDWNVQENLRFKAEAYYQMLDNVPIEMKSSSFSALNTGASFNPSNEDSLVNNGTGTNYGLELTAERFFNKGFYFLITGSLFDSKYVASDGIERNTAFNSKYVMNVLAGKEFKMGKHKNNVLVLNIKATTLGGKYFTPLDATASSIAGRGIYDESKAYSEQQTAYFRVDFKISFRKEYKHSTLEASIDLQNLTNNKNVFSQGYDPKTNKLYYTYQQGFFPVPLVRYTF
ncbi:MAG: TonB-dependent receptor [Bacteroidetes bacterium]|nr:TonB-dependent receptor [Bacteroidota bacterium]